MLTNDYYDLIVIGGGTAGTLCAIAAARSGLKTAVIERNSWAGRNGLRLRTYGNECRRISVPSALPWAGRRNFQPADRKRTRSCRFAVPMSSNKEVRVDRLRYDPEILKVILEEKAVSAGVDIFYDSELTRSRGERGLLPHYRPKPVHNLEHGSILSC